MDVELKTAVSQVTVYPDRARVSVAGTTTLETGSHRLLVEELPLTLSPDSLRVSGKGTAHVRILSVDVNRRHYGQTPAGHVRELEEQIEALSDDRQTLQNETAVWQAQIDYLTNLRQATAAFAKGLARNQSSIADQVELLEFMRQQDTAAQEERLRLAIAKRELDRQLEQLRRELKQWQSARAPQRYQACVEIDVSQAGEFTAVLTYVVKQASWQPVYDVRLQTNGTDPTVSLAYMAQITQNTGQDWAGVSLSVSTARPALNQRLPEQQPWYLDEYRPPQPRSRSHMVGAAPPDSARAVAMAAPAPAPPQVEAETAVADLIQDGSGTAVRFQVGASSDIPSDGSPHKTTLAHFNLPTTLDYLAIPYHTDAVFRRATLTNNSNSPLLAGNATLFVNNEYIGQTSFDYTPISDQLELHLGVEEAITVERELTRRDVDKRFLRDNRQMRFGYKISIKNLRQDAVSIVIHDQIPITRHEQIKVKLEDATPHPTTQSELNLLEWHIKLAPNQQEEIHFTYLVEHPRSLEIVGLRE